MGARFWRASESVFRSLPPPPRFLLLAFSKYSLFSRFLAFSFSPLGSARRVFSPTFRLGAPEQSTFSTGSEQNPVDDVTETALQFRRMSRICKLPDCAKLFRSHRSPPDLPLGKVRPTRASAPVEEKSSQGQGRWWRRRQRWRIRPNPVRRDPSRRPACFYPSTCYRT